MNREKVKKKKKNPLVFKNLSMDWSENLRRVHPN